MSIRDRLGLHTITLKNWSLEETCAGLSGAGVPAITLWRQAIEPVGVATAKKLVEDSGLRITSLCRGGFFPAVDQAGRQTAIDENLECIDEAAAVGAPAIVLVCGAVPGQSLQESRKQITDGIAAVLPHAKACGVKLSIEPLHPLYAADRSAVNTMGQARAMCEQLNNPGETDVGIAADVYHIWFDDALEAEIMASGKQGWLHAFHICDWKVEQADPLHDRGLMGEGVIDIRTIESWMSRAGYQGDIEVEIFSKFHWAKDPAVFLDEILVAYDACI